MLKMKKLQIEKDSFPSEFWEQIDKPIDWEELQDSIKLNDT